VSGPAKGRGGASGRSGKAPAIRPHEAAEAALEKGAVEEAARLFREALEKDPEDVPALVGIGRTALVIGRLPEALKAAERAVKRAPGDRDANLLSGAALEADGKLDQAIPRYEAAVKADAKHLRARFQLGRALGAAKRYDEAVPVLEAAAALDTTSHEAAYALALCEEGRGNTGAAIEAVTRAIEANPAFLDGYLTLADLLSRALRNELALKVLEQAASLFPRSGLVADKAAAIAHKSGDTAQALLHLERQVDLEPSNARAYLNLSTFAQLAGDMARAERAAERLAALDPTSWEAQFHLASIYEAVGLIEKAKTRHKAAIERGPKAWQPRSDLGRILASEGEKDRKGEAARLLEEAVKLAPEGEPAPRLNLALARLALGDRKKATALLKDVLAKAPPGHRLHAQAVDALAVAEAK